jgi:hypothetical protein
MHRLTQTSIWWNTKKGLAPRPLLGVLQMRSYQVAGAQRGLAPHALSTPRSNESTRKRVQLKMHTQCPNNNPTT